jgi:hypothetical protein
MLFYFYLFIVNLAHNKNKNKKENIKRDKGILGCMSG